MKNYNKLIERVDGIDPLPAIFSVNSEHSRYNNETCLNFTCGIPSKSYITKPITDDDFISNLVESNMSMFFSRIDKDVRINKQDAIDGSINEIKSDLVDIFLEVSPNIKPKLTGIYRKLNKMSYKTFSEEQHDLLINVWLYSKKNLNAVRSVDPSDEDKKHINNLHGLLGVVANRLIRI